MALIKVEENQKRVLIIALIFALIFAFLFLRSYMMLIIFSAIMAYLFNPINSWFLRKGRSPSSAAVLTFFASMLAIIIPAIIIITITVFQIGGFVDKIASGHYSVGATDTVTHLIDTFNNTLARFNINYTASIQQFASYISSAAATFGKALLEGVLHSVSGFFAFITTAIIYIYVFLSMVRYKDKIIDTLKRLNPLGDEVSQLYLDRVGAMTKATVRGQFIIAVIQGVESAFVLSLVGVDGLFFFMALFLTVLSLIPLGAGIVTIPIGIIMILTGNIWQGIVVIANHLLIVTNVDNVLRPKLVPQSARLDPALMILAVFCGIGIFGFIGIVIGPVIMILLLTTLQIFLEVFHNIESIDDGKKTKNKGRIAAIKKRFGLTK